MSAAVASPVSLTISLERNDDVVNECDGGRAPTAVQPTRLITKRNATERRQTKLGKR